MKESEELEFKTSFSEETAIIESLVAFANRRGGTVMVGMNDDGEPVKIDIGKKTIEKLTTKIKEVCDPVLYPSVVVKTHGLFEICEISVKESEYKPVFVSNKAFIRVGKSNVKLKSDELRSMILKYAQPDFDKRPCSEKLSELVVSPRVLEVLAIKNPGFNPVEFIRKNKLEHRGMLTNAAYLCFTEKNTEYYNACVKAGRFKGTDMATIIDMTLFDDGLLAVTEQAMAFIRRNIRMGVEFDGGVQRIEKWEYPLEALREVIANAIIHRDYTDKSQIQIRIFDDRLEVWSPGILPRELTPEEIIRENRSVPRNTTLAGIFYNTRQIESWGSGFPRIFSESEKHGEVNVSMRYVDNFFVVSFVKKATEKPDVKQNYGVLNDSPEVVYKSSKPVFQKTTDLELNKPQLLVYRTISANPGLMAKDLSAMLQIPFGSIDRHVRVLLKKGLIVRKGSKKTGGYVILK